MHKLYKSKSSKTKLTDLNYISDKNNHNSKLYQKVIILKVFEKIMYINYSLVMFKFWKLNAPIQQYRHMKA